MREIKFLYKEKKYLAFALSALALLSFVLACTLEKPWLSVLFGVLAGLFLIAGCVLLYLVHKDTAGHTNYFLFDRRRRIKLSPKELTFDFINDNLTYYLSAFVKEPLALWEGIPKELDMELEAKPAFRTPVAFKMLFDLSTLPATDIEGLFFGADKRTVAFVCRAVKAGGDKEMADIIFEMKCNPDRLGARVVPFFTKNRRPFEARLYRYVKDHLDEYDTVSK